MTSIASRQRSVRNCALIAQLVVTAGAAFAQLGPVPVPAENPITEPKRILGKMLFWDEQMSSDNTMACGTCHTMTRGGADNRRVRHPGADNLFFTADDVFGSPGVVSTASNGDYLPSASFGLAPQPGNRAAPPVINAAYAPLLFHDGKASNEFRDPITNAVVIPAPPNDEFGFPTPGGALESQVVGPIMNDIEMAHKERSWTEIISKLQSAKPLAFASNLTPDIAAALTTNTTYPDLFAAAFGDSAITPVRIAFAIATYERTLISDQTPFDAWMMDPEGGALTPTQLEGLTHFFGIGCDQCHTAPLFTDNKFNNIGLRPWQHDAGRALITGNYGPTVEEPNRPDDRGKFKSVNLRNVGLKTSYMHHGGISTLLGTIDFYRNIGNVQFTENRDPQMIVVADNFNAAMLTDPQADVKMEDFLRHGLADPRVANGTFPFDSPTLWSLRPQHQSTSLPGGMIGTNGITPTIVVSTPAMIGNGDFKIGLSRALGGAVARLGVSSSPPVSGVITPDFYLPDFTTAGSGPGAGYATAHWPIPNNGALAGQTRYVQWFITDPGAPSGVARSVPVQFTYFCSQTLGCPPICSADIANGQGLPLADGGVDISDLLYFLQAFEAGSSAADLDDDGLDPATPDNGIDINDLLFFLGHFEAGC